MSDARESLDMGCSAPVDPVDGQIWEDTSHNPSRIMQFVTDENGSSWRLCVLSTPRRTLLPSVHADTPCDCRNRIDAICEQRKRRHGIQASEISNELEERRIVGARMSECNAIQRQFKGGRKITAAIEDAVTDVEESLVRQLQSFTLFRAGELVRVVKRPEDVSVWGGVYAGSICTINKVDVGTHMGRLWQVIHARPKSANVKHSISGYAHHFELIG